MAVRFDEIVFHNDSGIDVHVTIEAPSKTSVVVRHPVPANSTYKVSPGKEDCLSATIEAFADHHGSGRQEFVICSPAEGLPSFLSRLETRFVAGSHIRGRFVAANS